MKYKFFLKILNKYTNPKNNEKYASIFCEVYEK